MLRGFALFGILLVNALVMAGPRATGTITGLGELADPDTLAGWLVTVLAVSKFYLLFSFLFGYSFALQLRAARRAGQAAAPRHLRRLMGLFVLGVAHGVLLFPGDILTTYAVVGLVLYACRDLPPRRLARLAFAVMAFLVCLLLLFGTAVLLDGSAGDTGATAAPVYDRNEMSDVLPDNLRMFGVIAGYDLLYAPSVLAAFLAGLAAAKVRLLSGDGHGRRWARPVLTWGLPLGLAGGVVSAVCTTGPADPGWYWVGKAVGLATAPLLTASYAGGLLLMLEAGRARPAARFLGCAGRLALTHYLTHSVVMAVLLTGFGAALYDRLGAATVLAGCLVLYLAQLAVSPGIVTRFGKGPAEALLRRVTYGPRRHLVPAGGAPDTERTPASAEVNRS